jgi:GMP synthase-like glutamine amidotransferase
MRKKKVLIIDYYRARPDGKSAPGAEEIKTAIKDAGHSADIMHHSEAEASVKKGEDILKGYGSAHVSGSDIPWNEKTGEDGRTYMHPGSNVLQKYLVSHKKPVKFECGGGQAAASALGYRVRNTGKFNRGIGKDGHMYHHKYGIEKGDLDDRVRNVETITHQGKEYVSAFDHGNKSIVQYHTGRTEKGKKEIKKFHGYAA